MSKYDRNSRKYNYSGDYQPAAATWALDMMRGVFWLIAWPFRAAYKAWKKSKTAALFLLLLANYANAQQAKPWEKFKMDSTEFISTFGTVPQYQYQESIKQKSSSGNLCLFTGAKGIWLYNFATWLGSHGYNVTWSPSPKNVMVKAVPKIGSTTHTKTLVLTAPINAKGVVTSVTITGPADDLINTYVGYWELTDISFDQLKTKHAAVKDFVSDRVIFSWAGSSPKITVTKNPDAPLHYAELK